MNRTEKLMCGIGILVFLFTILTTVLIYFLGWFLTFYIYVGTTVCTVLIIKALNWLSATSQDN